MQHYNFNPAGKPFKTKDFHISAWREGRKTIYKVGDEQWEGVKRNMPKNLPPELHFLWSDVAKAMKSNKKKSFRVDITVKPDGHVTCDLGKDSYEFFFLKDDEGKFLAAGEELARLINNGVNMNKRQKLLFSLSAAIMAAYFIYVPTNYN